MQPVQPNRIIIRVKTQVERRLGDFSDRLIIDIKGYNLQSLRSGSFKRKGALNLPRS